MGGRYQFGETETEPGAQAEYAATQPAHPDRSAELQRALQHLTDTQIPQIRRLVDETRIQVEALRGEFTARYSLLDEAVQKARSDLSYLRGLRDSAPAPRPAFSAGSASSGQHAPASEPVHVAVSEADDYRAAFEDILAGNLAVAAQRLDEFVVRYPSDRLSGGAWYWLGEVNLRLGRDVLARRALEHVLRAYPSHPSVPDAMYRLAVIHAAAGDHEAAAGYRARLSTEHPDSAAAMQLRSEAPLHH